MNFLGVVLECRMEMSGEKTMVYSPPESLKNAGYNGISETG